jgi:large repetitive protein
MKKSSQVDDGCVLYLSNRKKSSSIWSDLSKAGNNGTVNGATVARQGYSFDGSSSIGCGNKSNLDLTLFSIISWINIVSHIAEQAFVTKSNDGGVANYELSNYGSKPTIRYYNSGDYILSGASATVEGIWQQIVGTWDGTKLRIYVNGVLSNTSADLSATPPLTNISNLVIGTRGTAIIRYNGQIGEVRVYNRALSASEILNHYGKTRKFYGV